jgi:hypothetical protein
MGTPYSVINDYLFPGGMSVASIQSITKGLLEELDDREELGSLNADYEKLQSILDQGVVSLPPAEWVLVPTPVPLEQRITLFVDPVNPMVREHLSWLRRLQMMRMGAIQVDFRFLSPVGCSGDSESVDEGCRMARLLACSFSTAKGEELLQRLDQPGTTDTEVLQRQVTTDVPEIGACLATGTPGEILDADGAIAARLNVHMGEPVLFANGYRIDGPTNPKELIQILSGALLRAHASAQP